MGGERVSSTLIMKVKDGEVPKIKDWLKKSCPEDKYPILPTPPVNIPDMEVEEEKDIERGIYFSFEDFNPNEISMDMPVWDKDSQCFATLLAKKFFSMFKVEKAGWDSVGYFDDFLNQATDGISMQDQEKLKRYQDKNDKEMIEFCEMMIKEHTAIREACEKEVDRLTSS